nr:carboxypeptidase-like regulatory domain-containing protein [Bacteroidota bacterium]
MKTRTRNYRILILNSFCATLLISAFLFAGNAGKISGRVTDRSTGEPLISANVVVKGLKIGAATDINGDYFILNVPPGTYTLSVSMLGYESINS